ncbi:hypothetical protein EDB19DRAFT_1905108 [Suillus lakei]|nr:hypothetical protein EDB19DRAFT_1905108 [Suillus lakei]
MLAVLSHFLGRIASPHRQSHKMMDMTCARHTCWESIQNRREGPNQVTYQTGSKSTKLLPLTGAAKGLFTKSAIKAAEPKGKLKIGGPTGQALPAKRGAGQTKAA